MFKVLFNIIINLVATIIQIVLLPINAIITATLPDLTGKISSVVGTISTIFNNMNWALGLIPPILAETILFIITCEIARQTIYISTHALVRMWNVIQKLKFW